MHVRRFFSLRKCLIEYIRFIKHNKSNDICVFMGTPRHKNLGDHAIVYAQYKYIRKMFPNLSIFEFSKLECETYGFIIKRIINRNALIVVDGGGNLGTLWPEEDALINKVISDFQNNRIIIFPQTAYYEGENSAELIRSFSRKVNSHKDITFMVRDKASYNLFCDYISNTKLQLCPDIVLSLKEDEIPSKSTERAGIAICIRDDKESVIGKDIKADICSTLNQKGYKYKFITTFADHNIYPAEREQILKEKWKEFASFKLVITDRLHGMIFSAITDTPCIAFDNLSGKVSGGYEWVKDLGYVLLCKNIDDLDELMNSLN